MSGSSATRTCRGVLAATGAAVLLVLGTAAVVSGVSTSASGPPRPAALTVSVPTGTPSAAPAPSAGPADAVALSTETLPRSRPVSLRIPSIDVSSPSLVDLATQPDGSLEVPSDPADAGWYSPGPAPGQFGPAVLAGHVDGGGGPGVFYRLGELQPGAQVEVTREDGTVARFVVDKVERYPKDRFPTLAVYGDTTHRAELRLITCGGEFDDATGHYVDNVVAYAHLV